MEAEKFTWLKNNFKKVIKIIILNDLDSFFETLSILYETSPHNLVNIFGAKIIIAYQKIWFFRKIVQRRKQKKTVSW